MDGEEERERREIGGEDGAAVGREESKELWDDSKGEEESVEVESRGESTESVVVAER